MTFFAAVGRMRGSFWVVARRLHSDSFIFRALLIKRFRDSYLETVAELHADLAPTQLIGASAPWTSVVGFFFVFFTPPLVFALHGLMMERIRKEMILMERGLHSPVAGKRLADTPGNSVLEALENSQHSGRLSPRITSASLHGNLGDIPTKGKFEIDSLFGSHHNSENTSAEISSSESRKKMSLYSEVSPDSDINSDVEVGCPSHRSPSQHKENNKGNILVYIWLIWPLLSYGCSLTLILHILFFRVHSIYISKIQKWAKFNQDIIFALILFLIWFL